MSPRIRTVFKSALFWSLRLAFRMVPMSTASRDRMRQWFIDRHGDLVPAAPRSKLVGGNDRVRRPQVRADERAIGYVPYATGDLPAPSPATLVAFYLPQFHPIPENDEWWGKGFTEWRNVTRALPQFEGHHQPRLPGDLGFYDLRDPQVMREQARLAREYGIGAFCFYFYWFGGKTLLESPLRNWLRDPGIDLPFCLCWANEKWTRTWDGRGDQVLIDQVHSAEDDLAFIEHVAEYLGDPRCLKVEGRPMLLVYRPGVLPDPVATCNRWRTWCRENGVGEIHLAYVRSFDRSDPVQLGFDSSVDFPPNLFDEKPIDRELRLVNPGFSGRLLDWRHLAQSASTTREIARGRFPGVSAGWDNEPRRPGNGRVFVHAAPRRYRDWLASSISRFQPGIPASARLVFVNAWNEWGEGAVLEPDARLGYAYLDATRQALAQASTAGGQANRAPALSGKPTHVVLHVWYLDVLDELLDALLASGIAWHLIVTTEPAKVEPVRQRLETIGIPYEIVALPNRGRDVLPFLHVADRLLREGVDVVLKIHTKRSIHRADGDEWRRRMTTGILGKDRVEAILATFRARPEIGLVAPDGDLVPLDEHWGINEERVDNLLGSLGIPRESRLAGTFVAGTMFWIRLAGLRPVLDAHLSDSDFEIEAGQLDGTMAHALERVISTAVEHAGLQVVTASSLARQPGAERPASARGRFT